MRGTIRRRKKDVFEITVERERDAAGKRRRRSRTVRGTKTDAERELRTMVDEAGHARSQGPRATETEQ